MHIHLRQRVEVLADPLYRVVADVEHYPAFLPGWRSVRVIRRQTDTLLVEQQLGFGPLTLRFRSTARPQPPTRLRIHSDDGPFQHLSIDWRIEPIDLACSEVVLDVDATARGGLVAPLIESNLQRTARELIPLFVQRAHDIA